MHIQETVENWSIEFLSVEGISLGPCLIGTVNGIKMRCGGFLKRTGNVVVTEVGTFKVGKKSDEYQTYLNKIKEKANDYDGE